MIYPDFEWHASQDFQLSVRSCNGRPDQPMIAAHSHSAQFWSAALANFNEAADQAGERHPDSARRPQALSHRWLPGGDTRSERLRTETLHPDSSPARVTASLPPDMAGFYSHSLVVSYRNALTLRCKFFCARRITVSPVRQKIAFLISNTNFDDPRSTLFHRLLAPIGRFSISPTRLPPLNSVSRMREPQRRRRGSARRFGV